MSPWPFIRLLLLPAMVVMGYLLGGWYNFITPFVCFVIHPVLNICLRQKQTANEHHHHEKNYPAILFRITALLYVPLLTVLTAWAIYITTMTHFTVVDFIGLSLSVGIINGVIGFTLAHEFIHRHNAIEKVAGYLLLLSNFYMHYGIEHVWGHHVYACTEKDPHTAKAGESFYVFFPRAIKSTFLNAWEIEQKRKHRNKPIIGFNNHMVFYILLQGLLLLFVILFAGWIALVFFLLQSFVSVLLLHVVNYLQHYGLLRKTTTTGKIEKMAAHHSWNSGNQLKGLNFFHLENHADHHINPSHNYEELISLNDSPQHPTGYSGMILLALIPPLWFHIINKKLSYT